MIRAALFILSLLAFVLAETEIARSCPSLLLGRPYSMIQYPIVDSSIQAPEHIHEPDTPIFRWARDPEGRGGESY